MEQVDLSDLQSGRRDSRKGVDGRHVCLPIERFTVVGNAICADGAAAVMLTSSPLVRKPYPAMVDFESFLDPDHLQTVEFDHREGKLRHSLSRSDIRSCVAH